MITPAQCKAARALLGWNQRDLADAANISLSTVCDFEIGHRKPIARNRDAILDALSKAGIVFIAAGEGTEPADGPGVRLRK